MSDIAIFGLGYVGTVCAACFAANGHRVVGVDPNLTKVEMVNAGRSPVIEEGLNELVSTGVRQGRIRATTNAEEAVAASTVSMICVGTPSHTNGRLDLTHVEKVCQEIGLALAGTQGHTVVVRSTMLPGSTEEVAIPALEAASGLLAGVDFGVCVNPEFLREGSSVRDFNDPPFTLIGGDDALAARTVAALYEGATSEVIVAPMRDVEMVKYASNAFHATKVVFANEIGAIAAEHGADSHEVMRILCRDTRLNISSAYLTPGFAFGGSCLPKDLRALVYGARRADVDAPMLESILRSNRGQVDRALAMIERSGRKRVAVLGFSFKAGTDDLRESPLVELIERLIGKGYPVRVYDRNVSLANLQGANRAYIEREIPHIASLMAETIDEAVSSSDVIVIGNADPAFASVVREARPDQIVVDLIRIAEPPEDMGERYRGIAW